MAWRDVSTMNYRLEYLKTGAGVKLAIYLLYKQERTYTQQKLMKPHSTDHILAMEEMGFEVMLQASTVLAITL